jgi:hypothetical protein
MARPGEFPGGSFQSRIAARMNTVNSSLVLSEANGAGQLPLWDERNRGIPVTFVRSALFSVGGKNTRKMLSKHTIASQPGEKLIYNGEELRTDDEDVLIALFHLARGSAVHPSEGVAVRFSGHAMLRELEWKVSKEGYERLKNCLTRMQNGSLQSIRKVGTRRLMYSGQVIRKFVVDLTQTKQQWCVWLEPEICRLFEPGYAELSWSERLRLSRPLARWLHSFMSTVSPEVIFIAPETALLVLSGSGASTMPKFRQLLKESLKELQAKELIFDWKLAEGHLYVARQKEHDINRASQAAALAFEQQHQFLQLTDEESSGKKRPTASS